MEVLGAGAVRCISSEKGEFWFHRADGVALDEFDQKMSSSYLENSFAGAVIAKLLGAKLSNVLNSANQDPLRHPPR